ATPLHQQRSVRLATWDGTAWLELRQKPVDVFPQDMRQNSEHPQILFDAGGTLTMVFRHWTRRNARTIGSPITWENFVTRFDGASFDYISLTDHQTGYDQEFTWWENQQLVDLFQVPGFFTPLYGSERSLNFPNGHRNTIFAQRGVRPLPIPADEASAKVGAAR